MHVFVDYDVAFICIVFAKRIETSRKVMKTITIVVSPLPGNRGRQGPSGPTGIQGPSGYCWCKECKPDCLKIWLNHEGRRYIRERQRAGYKKMKELGLKLYSKDEGDSKDDEKHSSLSKEISSDVISTRGFPDPIGKSSSSSSSTSSSTEKSLSDPLSALPPSSTLSEKSSFNSSISPGAISSFRMRRVQIESYELNGKIHVGIKGQKGEKGIEGPPGPLGEKGVCMCSVCSRGTHMTRDKWISSMTKSTSPPVEENEVEYGCEESLKTYVDNLTEKLEREGYKTNIQFALRGRDGDVGSMGELGETGLRGMDAVCTATMKRDSPL